MEYGNINGKKGKKPKVKGKGKNKRKSSVNKRMMKKKSIVGKAEDKKL